MRDDSSHDQPTLRLPASRTLLRAFVVAVMLPLALIGSSATSSFCCNCSVDTDGASDFFTFGFLSASTTISFPSPDGTAIVPNKKRTNLFRFIPGVGIFFPDGLIDLSGDVSVDSSSRSKLPKKIDVEVEHVPAGERGQRVGDTVLKSTIKIKKGKINQSMNLTGFVADVNDAVILRAKPKGGDLANDQTAQLALGYKPSARGALTALSEYGRIGLGAAGAGRDVLGAVPDNAMVIPVVFPAVDAAQARAKTRLVRVRSGVAFDTVSADVQLGGAFIGTREGRSSAPKTIKVAVTLKDKNGKKKLSVQYKLTVNGNNVASQTKSFGAVKVEVDDVLDINVTPKGGNFDPSEPFFFFVTVAPTG
ncbi:MAG: hypothetical protein GKS06_07985 [Acidobacteria bacterium]|nr:hypothetical protein [Acidobacteriota bacterium]